tara:strand:- start:551 stop:736 length:186 start_codon:yes stop_codon:yes gene_type:complete
MFSKRFLTTYSLFYNKLFKTTKNEKLVLGRWAITYNKTQIDRKVYLANYDNCGPCGNILNK